MDTNDNVQAIKLLDDVSCILKGIESDNAPLISAALVNLKKHTADLEAVFYKNLVNSVYGKQGCCYTNTMDSMAAALAAFGAFRAKDLP